MCICFFERFEILTCIKVISRSGENGKDNVGVEYIVVVHMLRAVVKRGCALFERNLPILYSYNITSAL